MRLIKGAIIGGIIFFIWTAISWSVLPFHAKTMRHFTNESAVASVIQANAPTSGAYFMPSMYANQKADAGMPMVFASVFLPGMPSSMWADMVYALITDIVGAFFITWMLTKMSNSGYGGRLWFTVIFGLTAGIVAEVPAMTWFAFPLGYTVVMVCDLIIGWFLAGLALAKIAKPK